MKCDELQQVENPIEWGLYYDKSEVDAAIAELKAENERLNNALDKERSETIKYMDELCNAKNEIERLTIDKRNAELRADVADAAIAELKQKLEDAKATAYAESVDAGMRERRLQRALWLARAISAINAVGEIHNVIVCMQERNPKMSLSNTKAQEQVWKNVARKCREKAEQYK